MGTKAGRPRPTVNPPRRELTSLGLYAIAAGVKATLICIALGCAGRIDSPLDLVTKFSMLYGFLFLLWLAVGLVLSGESAEATPGRAVRAPRECPVCSGSGEEWLP